MSLTKNLSYFSESEIACVRKFGSTQKFLEAEHISLAAEPAGELVLQVLVDSGSIAFLPHNK